MLLYTLGEDLVVSVARCFVESQDVVTVLRLSQTCATLRAWLQHERAQVTAQRLDFVTALMWPPADPWPASGAPPIAWLHRFSDPEKGDTK